MWCAEEDEGRDRGGWGRGRDARAPRERYVNTCSLLCDRDERARVRRRGQLHLFLG